MRAIVRAAVDLFTLTLNLRLEMEVAGDLDKIDHVLINLIGNGIDLPTTPSPRKDARNVVSDCFQLSDTAENLDFL